MASWAIELSIQSCGSWYPSAEEIRSKGYSALNHGVWLCLTWSLELRKEYFQVLLGCGSIAQVTTGRPADLYSDFQSVCFGWGFALMVGILVSGGVSGGHLNPAVTWAMAFLKKCKWIQVFLPNWSTQEYMSYVHIIYKFVYDIRCRCLFHKTLFFVIWCHLTIIYTIFPIFVPFCSQNLIIINYP